MQPALPAQSLVFPSPSLCTQLLPHSLPWFGHTPEVPGVGEEVLLREGGGIPAASELKAS